MYVIRLIQLASGEPDPYEGYYVLEYAPAPMDRYGRLLPGYVLSVTADALKAKRFETAADALREYRRSEGLRPDGRPNRPMTAWTVEIMPLPS